MVWGQAAKPPASVQSPHNISAPPSPKGDSRGARLAAARPAGEGGESGGQAGTLPRRAVHNTRVYEAPGTGRLLRYQTPLHQGK